ncbi:MAG TPA: SLC13 family permease [Dehalococcoidia bacterium]|nr:SLC13 family permease [Dehalococcoidia bacterium]
MSDFVSPEARLFAIIAVAIALLVSERIRADLVGVLIVVALWAARLLNPDEALAGFSSEPAIAVAAVFVLGAGLLETGVSDAAGRLIARWSGPGLLRPLALLMGSVGLLSAFTHHVTTTASMVPVALDLSKERDIPPSRLLMPISFAASLGTTITIIGAPAFLIASDALQGAGEPPLGVFSVAPLGLALLAAGVLFMLLTGRWLLPDRRGVEDPSAGYRLDGYLTEIEVQPGSPLLDKSAEDLATDRRYEFEVVGRIRDGSRVPGRFAEGDLQEGDVLLVRTSPEHMLAVGEERGIELGPTSQYERASVPRDADEEDVEERLVQVVVAAASDFAGRTIAQVDFRQRFGVLVLGLWRQRGWLADQLAHVRLQPGDVLVVQGDEDALARLSADRGVLMLVPFQGRARVLRKRWLALAILLGAIALAIAGAPLQMAMLVGAAAMVLTRCVTPGQAYRAIDQRVFVFIAGAIPLGAAMEKTGAARTIAELLEQPLSGATPFIALLAIFVAVALVTQFMSDAATTALFAPIALGLAGAIGVSPTACVVTVAVGSVASSITPLGHHGNLLVYGPGGYRFSDFVRAGTPLTLLVGVIAAAGTPLLWP